MDLFRSAHALPPWHEGLVTLYYTHKGRCGLGLLCKEWSVRAGDEVLAPAYNCGTELDPFLRHGAKVTLYRVDDQANIDLADLLEKVTPRTRVIYITHYFGWPQDIGALSHYCSSHDIRLIEDCALALFSAPRSRPLGLLGDAAIYSFPKSLSVPDGGALTLRTGSALRSGPAARPPVMATARDLLSLMKRGLLRLADTTGVYGHLARRTPTRPVRSKPVTPTGLSRLQDIPSSYYYDATLERMTASAVTRHILRRTSAEAVATKRRQNYLRLNDAIKGSDILTPLFRDLPEGVCPLSFPVLVADRGGVCRRLNAAGIGAVQWWAGYHRAFDWTAFPEARYLKDHLLTLPIHQQLDAHHMDYIAGCLV